MRGLREYELKLTDTELDALFWAVRQPNQVVGKLKPALVRARNKLQNEKWKRRSVKIYNAGATEAKNKEPLTRLFEGRDLGSMEFLSKKQGYEEA